jgi:hypothetical protein
VATSSVGSVAVTMTGSAANNVSALWMRNRFADALYPRAPL